MEGCGPDSGKWFDEVDYDYTFSSNGFICTRLELEHSSSKSGKTEEEFYFIKY
jgi:hypothetical protein